MTDRTQEDSAVSPGGLGGSLFSTPSITDQLAPTTSTQQSRVATGTLDAGVASAWSSSSEVRSTPTPPPPPQRPDVPAVLETHTVITPTTEPIPATSFEQATAAAHAQAEAAAQAQAQAAAQAEAEVAAQAAAHAQTSAPAASSAQTDQVSALAHEAVRLLEDYEAAAGGAGEHAQEAAELVVEIERLSSAAPAVDEHTRAQRWEAVLAARSAYRGLLDGDAVPAVSVTSTDLVDAEMLHREFEQAEAKARRSMSGPGAFKKFAAARKSLNDFLDRFGVESFAELQQLASSGGSAGVPATLQEAADAVAAAEADWIAVDSPNAATGLPANAEMDALRVRSYRVLGAVVDDTELVPRLSSLAESVTSHAPILRQLSFALQALGLPADSDPVASARAIRDQLRRS